MSRDYCFTVFEMNMFNFDKEKIKYVIWGREICPKSGRKHLQGYACFLRTHRIPSAQKILGIGKSHMEVKSKNSSREQCRDYCMKDGDWEEWGQFEKRTKEDLFNLPIGIIKQEYPEFFCRYHKGLEKLQPKGDKWRDVDVTVLWGESGSGKTRTVMEMDSVYKLDPPYKWFDGYEGENILLLDDYESGSINRGLLLNLLDGYRMRLETKGSHTYALWKKVYITSNENPKYWSDKALSRRINSITNLVCDVTE